jgi:hypothetical protein
LRRYATILMVALVAIALVVSGCGNEKKDESSSSAPVDLSAQEIFDKTMAASSDITSMTATMDMELAMKMAASASPDPSTALLTQGPITMSGDLAGSAEPAAGEGTINVSLGGQSMQFGFKLVDDQMYLDYMGTWYEAPADAMKELNTQQQQMKSTDPLALLKEMGVDPSTWASEMTVVGTEEVAGVDTYHVKVDVDTTAMITDVLKMMQSPEVTKALGDSAADLGDVSSLSDADLAQMKEIFKSATLDVWSQTDTFYPRKMAIAVEIVPPADESGGLESMTMTMDLVYDTVNEPVTVEAPADAKPWKELQPALEGLGSMLGGGI